MTHHGPERRVRQTPRCCGSADGTKSCYLRYDAREHSEDQRRPVSDDEALTLHPLDHPMGDGHHTDAPYTDIDRAIGDHLAFYMGTLFSDVDGEHSRYWYHERTSVDEWSRVARALRIHGLRIVNAVPSVEAPLPTEDELAEAIRQAWVTAWDDPNHAHDGHADIAARVALRMVGEKR